MYIKYNNHKPEGRTERGLGGRNEGKEGVGVCFSSMCGRA